MRRWMIVLLAVGVAMSLAPMKGAQAASLIKTDDGLEFQFHRALCREAGFTGPLYKCSIYGNKAAGAKLDKMLQLGLSRPWPEALEAMTGEKQMDATAILDYFAPLKRWLDEQNRGRKVGY